MNKDNDVLLVKSLNILEGKLSSPLSPFDHEALVFQGGVAITISIKAIAIVISRYQIFKCQSNLLRSPSADTQDNGRACGPGGQRSQKKLFV